MSVFAAAIVTYGRRVRNQMEKLLAGISPEIFARLARPGGTAVRANHPAFIYGHLSLYPARLLRFLGREAGAANPPAEWIALFGTGAHCHDDPAGTIYPPMNVLTAACLRSYDAVLAALPETTDEVLAQPTPDERYRSFLPTIGTAALGMLSGHPSFHLGQVSTWRRCMGLPPLE